MAEKTLSRIFTEGDDSSNLLTGWWKALDQHRGERASLRRASSPTEVAFCPSFYQLLGQLREQGYQLGQEKVASLAAVAGIAAHIKSNTGDVSFARQMATPKSVRRGARVSGLRFRRLLAVKDRDELYPMLIRVVRLLDGNVNPVSLANAVFWWNEKTKKDWAYEYYEKAPSEK